MPPPDSRVTTPAAETRSIFDDPDFAKALSRCLSPGDLRVQSPLRQSAWAGGAISLAARMLAAVPFLVVKDATESTAELKQAKRSARTAADFHLASRKLRDLVKESPRRVRDVSSLGFSRAPETAVERQPGHPLQKLFDRPSRQLSRFALWQGVCELLLDRGNALLLFEGKGTDDRYQEGEEPRAIRVFSQDNWSLETDFEGRPIGWKFNGSGGPTEFELHEIVHLAAGFVPEGKVWAERPLERAETRLALDLYALAWNKLFFEQGGEAGSTFETDKELDPRSPEAKAILEMWEARHQGVDRGHKPAILTHGLKLNRSPLGQRDMEFTKLLDSNRDAELASMGFHKAALGATEDINYAIIRDARRSVWTNVILPIAACIEEELFRALFEPVAGGQVYGIFDLSNVQELQDDVSERTTSFQTLIQAHVPYNRANEILGMGLPEEDWGDEPLVNAGLVPMKFVQDPFAGLTGGATEGESTAAPVQQIDAAKGIAEDVAAGRLPAEAAVELLVALGLSAEQAKKIVDAAEAFEPKHEPVAPAAEAQPENQKDSFDSGGTRQVPANLVRHPDHRRPTIHHATLGDLKAHEYWEKWWRAVGSAPEKKLQGRVRRYLFSMRAEVLDRVKSVAAPRSASGRRAARDLSGNDVERMLFDLDVWLDRLLKETTPAWEQAARLALGDLDQELGGISFNLSDPRWALWLETKEVKVSEINQRIRQALRAQLVEGVNAGENVTDLQKRVRLVMGAAAQPYRTLRIARTETAQAANGVRRMGMVAEGVETVQWVTSNDSVVRDSHQDFEKAGPQPIDTNWVKLSSHARGSKLDGPSDVDGHPSETVNCRCVVVAGELG